MATKIKRALIDYVKKGAFDEFWTPGYAVRPLLSYLDPSWTIWEPTDTHGKSEISGVLKANGYKVVSTGMKQLDFFTQTPNFHFDCIVTNPPYSAKDLFIRRCIEYGKPFALLLPITTLEGVERGKMLNNIKRDLGIMVFDRRVEYVGKSSWFNSSWFCYKLLKEPFVFMELKKEAA